MSIKYVGLDAASFTHWWKRKGEDSLAPPKRLTWRSWLLHGLKPCGTEAVVKGAVKQNRVKKLAGSSPYILQLLTTRRKAEVSHLSHSKCMTFVLNDFGFWLCTFNSLQLWVRLFIVPMFATPPPKNQNNASFNSFMWLLLICECSLGMGSGSAGKEGGPLKALLRQQTQSALEQRVRKTR